MPGSSIPLDGLSLDGGLVGGFVPGGPEVAAPDAAGWEDRMERIAADTYGIASMLLGEGEEAVGLIERVIGQAVLADGGDFEQVRHAFRLLAGGQAIALLAKRDAGALAVPELEEGGPVSCIDGDELDAAGVSSAELEAMLTGPDSQRLRSWIEGLPAALRITFVLRAVAGLHSQEVAGLLAAEGGASSAGWTPEAVRVVFRQALCSLAGQLLHATAER